ncbi:hypothetical protein ACQEVB_40755 [Pseudonocardia sp. CA-107938]|uniref:hypothetical protein n=1 Tax=Pseudonocardia sp. CA-107938 TaxID=3240021 RepID=UPI003D8E330D
MRLSDRLNERQRAVLSWIGNGCPDGVYDHPQQYKHTAGALRDRKLVTISKASGSWQALITERGRYYLEHDRYPEPLLPSSRIAPSLTAASAAGSSVAAVTKSVGATPVPPTPSVAELLRRLETGPVVVADPDPVERAAWRRLLDATRRSGDIPTDHHLIHRGRDRGDLIIELRAGRHPLQEQAQPQHQLEIYVPDEVAELHPLLKRLGRHAAKALRVSESTLPRALRLLHALFSEAEHRGCTVALSDAKDVDFQFGRGTAVCGLMLYEVVQYTHVLPDAEELAGTKTYAWQRVQPRGVSVPTGRLVLDVGQDWKFSGHRHRWAERERWNLEDKLGKVLREILHRLDATNERHADERREAEQRQLDWQDAMSRAREAFQRAARAVVLETQLANWDKAERIRAFCAAAAEPSAFEADPAARQTWLDWALAYADDIDPRLRPLRMPAERTPRPEDLRPYLKGWSPYGPERSHHY